MADDSIDPQRTGVTRAELYANRALGLKRCTFCKQTKPFADFNKSASRSDGLNATCRECQVAYRKRRTAADPDWQKRRSAKARELNSETLNRQARARYHDDLELSRDRERQKRSKNPEVYLAIGRKYREENSEDCNEASKLAKRARRAISREADLIYAEMNRERKREAGRIHRSLNRVSLNEKNRKRHAERYFSDPDYRTRCQKSVVNYAANNPEVIRLHRRNRKARVRGAEGVHSTEDVKQIASLQKWKCANPACGKSIKARYHVDHIMPIARGGSNNRRNLQLLCPLCNNRKHAKHPVVWARENGLLI